MKFQDLTKLIEQDESIFNPRRTDDRRERYNKIMNQSVQDYIKSGAFGNLLLSEEPITSLPSNLKKVGGHLSLHHTQIESLPEGLRVEGDLDVSSTPLKTLPKGLYVEGELDIASTQIEELPEDLDVRGGLSAYDTPLADKYTYNQIEDMLPNLTGWVYTQSISRI